MNLLCSHYSGHVRDDDSNNVKPVFRPCLLFSAQSNKLHEDYSRTFLKFSIKLENMNYCLYSRGANNIQELFTFLSNVRHLEFCRKKEALYGE